MSTKKNIIAVRVTDEQHEFLLRWQHQLQEELGMDIPLGALVRRMLDKVIHEFHTQGDSGITPGTEDHKQAVHGFMATYRDTKRRDKKK